MEVEREALVKGLPAKFIKQAKHSKTVSARSVIRTRDLLITSEMLYQLSYTSVCGRAVIGYTTVDVVQRFACLMNFADSPLTGDSRSTSTTG